MTRMADEELPVRLAARTVVIDPDGLVLLFHYDDGPPNGAHWCTPGGGLEPGETYEQAAARELAEETGWHDVPVGRELDRRSLTMEYCGRLVRQYERLYLARVGTPRRPLGDVAAMHETDRIAGWRWWSLDELDATAETVWPGALAALVRGVHSAGDPD